MRILCAADENSYSEFAIKETARLAANTWANVTILGTSPEPIPATKGGGARRTSVFKVLHNYRELFLTQFQEFASPYDTKRCGYEFIRLANGTWEELYLCRSSMKDLRVRLRTGNLAKAILAEAGEEESDLIVLGCDQERGCSWKGDAALPKKVVNSAHCSALLVTARKKIREILCCLDQENVSQETLEMVNQMVTIHKAKLKIVGLSKGKGLEPDVDKSMQLILDYYLAREITPHLSIVDTSQLESFLAQETEHSLISLVMGKRSLLSKILSKKKVDKLVEKSRSSVLILR
ncbi:MAG: universal stress protein [Deltaproteobacteria bacterium]|nr:universal stress protein [Deltaproteobacteria bacterium]